MVELKGDQEVWEIDQEDDAFFEAMAAKFPKRTDAEVEKELEEWARHPLNCKEITPKMLQQPEW